MKTNNTSHDKVKYVNVPVNPSSEYVYFRILVEGAQVDEQQLPISATPSMWAPIPIYNHGDKTITIEFDGNDDETMKNIDESMLRSLIEISDKPHDSATLYTEILRPQAHFSARRGFINDPNGLFYYNGTYHLFFQHNPYNLAHGNTHWGHAVSSDLIHWEEQDPGIKPDRTDGSIFSGSAVVDYNNTSGLQQGEHPPILLFYTATGMRFFPRFCRDPETGRRIFPPGWVRPETKQCIAYSTDGGKTFKKYEKNPIIDEITPMNRDPKVVWNQDINCWTMILYLSGNDFILLYSDDLLSWEKGQILTFKASGECPDIFELCVDNDESNRKWVIFVSPENYVVGHFEGRQFYAETDLIRGPTQTGGDKQKEFLHSPAYAPQTFFGIPDNRVIQLSWVTTAFPGMTFAGCMSLPWELQLITTPEGYQLIKAPIKELVALHGEYAESAETNPHIASSDLSGVTGEALDLTIDADLNADSKISFAIRGVLIHYDHSSRTLLFPTGKYDLPMSSNTLDLRVIADCGSIELFCCGGLFNCVLNSPLDPAKRAVEFFDLEATRSKIKLSKLNKIW